MIDSTFYQPFCYPGRLCLVAKDTCRTGFTRDLLNGRVNKLNCHVLWVILSHHVTPIEVDLDLVYCLTIQHADHMIADSTVDVSESIGVPCKYVSGLSCDKFWTNLVFQFWMNMIFGIDNTKVHPWNSSFPSSSTTWFYTFSLTLDKFMYTNCHVVFMWSTPLITLWTTTRTHP